MERGQKLYTKLNVEFQIKGKYPSGQMGYIEDHYLIEMNGHELRLSESFINKLFNNELTIIDGLNNNEKPQMTINVQKEIDIQKELNDLQNAATELREETEKKIKTKKK